MVTRCVSTDQATICWDDVYAPTDPAGGPIQVGPNPGMIPTREFYTEFDGPISGQRPLIPTTEVPNGTHTPTESPQPSRLIALPSFSFPNIFFSEILDEKRRAWLAGERPVPGSEITPPDWSSEGPPRIPGQAAPEPEAGPGPNPDVTGDATPTVPPLPAQRLGGVFWSGLLFVTRPGTTVGVGGIDRFDHLFDFPSPSRARRAPAVPSMPDPNTPVSDAEADAFFGYPYSAVPVPPHASQQPATEDGTGEATTSAPAAPPPTAGGTTAAAPSGGVGHEGDADLGNGFNPFADWPHLAEDDFEIGSQATDRTNADSLMLGVLAATDPNAAPVQTFVANPNPYFRSSEPSFFEIFGYQIPIPPVVLEVFGGTPTGASVVTRAPALVR